jgi:hypothetical protein
VEAVLSTLHPNCHIPVKWLWEDTHPFSDVWSHSSSVTVAALGSSLSRSATHSLPPPLQTSPPWLVCLDASYTFVQNTHTNLFSVTCFLCHDPPHPARSSLAGLGIKKSLNIPSRCSVSTSYIPSPMVIIFVVLGTKPRAPDMQGKQSTTKLCPFIVCLVLLFFFFFFGTGV